ncbi:MAG: aminopeptidase P family protein [Phaeodactylibacter sp.]|uniref:aminopeptidase P family protein n=1 Tax=Phaeodactylibacter sp. TaxID=1940289 RepID=UPI0032EF7F8B
MFKAKIYQERRKQLQEAMPGGLLLFPGNNESPMNCADNVYPFRQDSSFLYYFGINQPGLTGILDADSGKALLFAPEMTVEHVVWMGPQPGLKDLQALSGTDQALPVAEVEGFLKKAMSDGRDIHFLPPYRAARSLQLSEWLGAAVGDLQPSEALIKAVVAQRSLKTPEEIAEIEAALAITRQMHIQATQTARPGMKEAQLAGLVEGIALATESTLAYPAILTINGQTLHNHHHGNTLKEGDLVLCDFGSAAPRTDYASDITRTFPVSKTFTERQKAIYQIVLDAEEQSIQAIKPGVPYKDIHLLAAKIITTGLRELGLMKGDADAAVEAGAHALFFPHGLGHMMGLDVHDMEDLGEDHVGYTDELKRSPQFGLKSLRLARPLEAGFVLTVEPGIYFIPELIAQWKKEGKHAEFIDYDKVETYLDFGGIRIEDNILVTEAGYRVLGPAIPKTVEEIEALRKF